MLNKDQHSEEHCGCGCSHHEEEQSHTHKDDCCGGSHEDSCGCGSKHQHVAPATPDPKISLMIVDLASDDQDFELVSGFDDLEHMRSFAEAYRADSMERCRGGMNATAEDTLRNWEMFGEDIRPLDDSIHLFGEDYTPEVLSKEKTPEDMRDWRSIDPRNKLKGLAPDEQTKELLKD